jgi:hypothetical protein
MAAAVVGIRTAATELGLSPQTIRNRIKAGQLDASKGPTGRWEIASASLDGYIAAYGRGRQAKEANPDREVMHRLDELATSIDLLRKGHGASVGLLEAIERERDRYRAEAASAREAALRVVAAARDTYAAIEQLLPVLREQNDALAQLLAPGSPQDLMC